MVPQEREIFCGTSAWVDFLPWFYVKRVRFTEAEVKVITERLALFSKFVNQEEVTWGHLI